MARRYAGFDYGHPLALSDSMIAAVLSGVKTTTVRALNKEEQDQWCGQLSDEGTPLVAAGEALHPYGLRVGDYLWVRESYLVNNGRAVYRAVEDPTRETPNSLWEPVVGMPEKHSRIKLRVSRYGFLPGVQLLTDKDLIREGFSSSLSGSLGSQDMRHRFRKYWNTRYRKKGLKWESDPPIWIVHFRYMDPVEVSGLKVPRDYIL